VNFRLNIFLLSVITALSILLCLRECGNKPIELSPQKQAIKVMKASIDSVQKIVVFTNTQQIKIVNRWREVRHDSLIPCHELLVYCDTLVCADSSLISEQKVLLGMQDSVIKMQDLVIKSDSISITKLNKKIKNRKFIFWTGFVLGASTNLIPHQ
jgi:hypothetical protein